MMKKFARVLVPALVLSMTATTFVGCGGDKAAETGAAVEDANKEDGAAEAGTEAEGEIDTSKDTLIIATANEADSVTSNLHNSVAGDYINRLTYNGLFRADADLNAVPDLVDTYEIVSDTEWVFHLKQGVKFHNGEEMKAADVKASLDMTKECAEVSQYGKAYDTVEVVDDYTVKLITPGPQSGLLADLCHHGNMILPASLIESGHNFNKEPIGTGPYVMTAWNKGESFEFDAFPDYFKGEPAIKHIIWKVIPEGSSRTMALEAGEIDMIIEVENNDFPRLADNPDIATHDSAGTSHNFMMINNEIAPFNNIEFRRALASAIDKEAACKVAFNGGASPVDCLLPDGFPGTTTEGAMTFNPEEAKKHMEASGLNPADCGFSLICSSDVKLRVGQVIQSCLKDNLGIDIELESMDLATYLDKTATGDYQAAIGGYTSNTILAYAKGVFHSSSINAANKTRTNSPEIDALIEKLQATVDPAENEKVVTELNIALNEECAQVPIWMENNRRAYKKNLGGFNMNAGGNTYYDEFYWTK